MKEFKEEEFKEERKNGMKGAQYGKKGSKPRNNFVRKKINLDEVETNNIAYWNKTANFDNVTKFPWNLIVGHPFNVSDIANPADISDDTSGATVQADTTNYNPAQILATDIIVGPGWAADTNTGVNRALAQLMAKMRSTLSTSNFGFETADLGILLASISSTAMLIGYAKSVLESLNVWKDRNFAWPRALIKARGFDYDDVSAHRMYYGGKLKSIVDRYNGMGIPDISDVFDRQYVMMHNIYADEQSDLAQLYIFRPVNYYVYNDEDVPSKAECRLLGIDELESFDELLDVINLALDSWYNSSDLYQILGVMNRAFKEVPHQTIPQFDESVVVEPSTDREHLMQIMNSNIVPDVIYDSLGSYDITQDPTTQNYVIWKPLLANGVNGKSKHTQAILRLFEDDISQDDNMELTRLTSLWNGEGAAVGTTFDFENCGSEFVHQYAVFTYNTDNDSIQRTYITKQNLAFDNVDYSLSTNRHSVDTVVAISPFRYIPGFYLWDRTESVSKFKFKGILGDMYNWMVYEIEDWNQLQFTAYQSFWTPKV